MSTGVLFQQLIVLFVMMAAGYLAFRLHVFDRVGQHQISSLVGNVLNPFVMLSALAGERQANAGTLMRQSIILAVIYFVFLILCSFIYVKLRRPGKAKRYMQQYMLIFSNCGFFAIPIIRGLFGESYVIYLVAYLFLYNTILYTLGVYLAIKMGDKGGESFSIKKLLNVGTLSSLLAAILFVTNVQIAGPFASICSYLGNCCIPLSMILIGASLAQIDLKGIVTKKENWIFAGIKMLLIPLLGILIGKLLPFDADMKVIYYIELCMPVGAIAGVFAEEYAGKGNEANQMVALTTLVTIVSIPLLSLLF